MHVGVLVFVAYALVQANQLGGSTPTYDVYDSDNYPLVSSTTQELPRECHHSPLAIMQCTEHVLPKAQSLAVTQCTEHVLPKAQPLAITQCTQHVLHKAQPLAITQCTEHVLPKAQPLPSRNAQSMYCPRRNHLP